MSRNPETMHVDQTVCTVQRERIPFTCRKAVGRKITLADVPHGALHVCPSVLISVDLHGQ